MKYTYKTFSIGFYKTFLIGFYKTFSIGFYKTYTIDLRCVRRTNLDVQGKNLFCTPTYSRCKNLSTPACHCIIWHQIAQMLVL